MKYQNYKELKEKRPQLVKKLINWGLKRKLDRQLRPSLIETHKQVVEEEIKLYLEEIVFSPTKYLEALPALSEWDKVLSEQEKQAVGLIIPWQFPDQISSDRNVVNKYKDLLELIGILSFHNEVDLMQNWYDGTYKVLDEEIIDKVFYNSEDIGLVTMNSYGALVLNADEMLIIDIDNHNDNSDSPVLYPEQAIASLKVIQEKRGGSYRVYQTAGGIRAIETSKPYDPSYWQTRKLMKSVMADPLYIALCQNQETFRARLTPKPWRHSELAMKDYNHENGLEWLNSDSEVGVCRLLEVIGEDKVDERFSNLIRYHDQVTKALEPNLILV